MEALLSFLELDILVFLVRFEYVEAAKLVLGNRGISVERGQMVYGTETKLRFDVPKVCGFCKVGAVLNEPVTQKVGK